VTISSSIYLIRKAIYKKWCGAPGKVGGSKSSLEQCEESTEVTRAEKGPEVRFMLFLVGAQTQRAAVRFFE